MAQRTLHVPKFGNWDEDNVPYTAYFDNARKGKSGVRMNPNDPEENPEAFMAMAMAMEDDADLKTGAYEGTTAAKHNIEIESHKELNARSMSSSSHQKISTSYKSITSESGSENSNNSDQSLLQAGHRHRRSRHSSQKGGNTLPSEAHGQHHRAASIPKFGAWDETDPTSGEGFTVIFQRVKEEKEIASTTFPSVPPQPTTHLDSSQRNQRISSSYRSKFCCCLFSSRK